MDYIPIETIALHPHHATFVIAIGLGDLISGK
jgi:hypothetical protein